MHTDPESADDPLLRVAPLHGMPAPAVPLRVVLVSPRNPLNIGAVARAMANFGFADLAVVAPHDPHWREARSAVGAPELLQNAAVFATLAKAVADCTQVIGTGTLTYRKPEQPVVELPNLAPILQRESAQGGLIALVFGPEKHGLTREDLSWCHLLVEIPTDPRQPSMNLGQAVAVCLYEIATRAIAAPASARTLPGKSAYVSNASPLQSSAPSLRHISTSSPASLKSPCSPPATRPAPCSLPTGMTCACCCAGSPPAHATRDASSASFAAFSSACARFLKGNCLRNREGLQLQSHSARNSRRYAAES